GTDTVLGRVVAVKVLSASLAGDPSFVARFQREARAVASLNHPNLVGVFDTGSEGDLHYIVMEHVEGATLDAVIRQEAPLDPARVTDIATQVCEALAAAHAKGIFHRDIKPGNIMIEPGGRAKVMDFGIAKMSTDTLTQVGAVLGTVRYLAPEQAAGQPIDERADIYALGCVMYEMLTGKPPISGESLVEIVHKLATEHPAPPSTLNPEVPAGLDRVVMRALAKDPEDRYSSTVAMRMDLGRGLPDDVGAAPAAAAAGTPTLVQRPADRTRVIERPPPAPGPANRWLLVLALVLLAGGALALMMRLVGDQNPPAMDPSPSVAAPAAPAPVPSPTASPTQSPTPTPPSPTPSPESPTPSPTPDRDEDEPDPGRLQAVRSSAAAVSGVLDAGVGSGEISERAARNVQNEVEKVVAQYESGDIDDALEAVADARSEVQKYLEREELSPSRAAALTGRLAALAQIVAS
ncbi:MAG TPA: protein kinase, partial [Actinomycetota bacterium]|nr:protein kinase [Actinomycetota bacterium]